MLALIPRVIQEEGNCPGDSKPSTTLATRRLQWWVNPPPELLGAAPITYVLWRTSMYLKHLWHGGSMYLKRLWHGGSTYLKHLWHGGVEVFLLSGVEMLQGTGIVAFTLFTHLGFLVHHDSMLHRQQQMSKTWPTGFAAAQTTASVRNVINRFRCCTPLHGSTKCQTMSTQRPKSSSSTVNSSSTNKKHRLFLLVDESFHSTAARFGSLWHNNLQTVSEWNRSRLKTASGKLWTGLQVTYFWPKRQRIS